MRIRKSTYEWVDEFIQIGKKIKFEDLNFDLSELLFHGVHYCKMMLIWDDFPRTHKHSEEYVSESETKEINKSLDYLLEKFFAFKFSYEEFNKLDLVKMVNDSINQENSSE